MSPYNFTGIAERAHPYMVNAQAHFTGAVCKGKSNVRFDHPELARVAVEDIPQDVVRFLAEHIDSVVQLEVLLMLQSRSTTAWQAPDVATQLRISPDWTEAAMAKLASAGILQVEDHRYRFAPRTPELARTIESLAAAYEDRRVSVISLIFSKPPDPIRQFTDAFRFRKEEGG